MRVFTTRTKASQWQLPSRPVCQEGFGARIRIVESATNDRANGNSFIFPNCSVTCLRRKCLIRRATYCNTLSSESAMLLLLLFGRT